MSRASQKLVPDQAELRAYFGKSAICGKKWLRTEIAMSTFSRTVVPFMRWMPARKSRVFIFGPIFTTKAKMEKNGVRHGHSQALPCCHSH